MSRYKIFLRDGKELIVETATAPWFNYDSNLRESTIQFGADSVFLISAIIGYAKLP